MTPVTESESRSIRAEGGRGYELLVEIGSGGMGKVYLGRAVGMAGFERYVAIKCCHPHLTEDEEFAAMFLDEARIAARIHHPNVVPTLDLGESDVLFLVMEYVEGDRLSQLIRSAKEDNAPIPLPIALRIAVDVLAGLQAAHELRDADGKLLNVVHRDVTPQNVIVGIDGVARILDFGIATAASRATTTKDGHIKGKLGYLPPEQLSMKDAGPSSDVYALGVVLWESLAGQRLFRGATDAITIAQIMDGNVPSLGGYRGDVPETVDAIIRKATNRDLAERFSTASSFALAIEASGLPIASGRTVAAYAQERFGPALRERKAKLRAAMDGTPRVLTSRASLTQAAPAAPPASADDALAAPIRKRPSPGALVAVAIGVLVAIVVGRWLFQGDAALPSASPMPPTPAGMAAPAKPALPAEAATSVIAAEPAAIDAGTVTAERAATPAKRTNRPKRSKGSAAEKAKGGEWWPGRL